MTIAALDTFDVRDLDGTSGSDAHTPGAIPPHGSGGSMKGGVASILEALRDKVNEVVADGINALPLTASVLATPTKITVASGVLTVTQNYHTVEGEGTASDTIDSIAGGTVGQVIFLRPFSDVRDITLTNSATLINPAGRDIVLAEDDDFAMLIRVSVTAWVVLAFKTLAKGGGGLGSALAAVTTGLGASLIGIEDAAGLITAANVEAALLEHQNRLPTNAIADPGTTVTIPVTKSGEVRLVIGAGAETNPMAAPSFAGQEITIAVTSVGGGTRAITATQTINAAANTIMTFNATTDLIVLKAVTIAGTLKWRVVLNESVALS